MPAVFRRAARFLAPALMLLVAGCSSGDPAAGPTHGSAPAASPSARDGGVRKPPARASFDYQLGGPYQPPAGVRAVSRDRTADPVPGLYNICYVNAFQSQPGGAVGWWQKHHSDLLLHDRHGEPVVDEDWQEPLLDISGAAKREKLAGIVGRWIDGCADAGFDAVEPDNLDSYERSDHLLTADDAASFARLLATRAHRRGLAIAQKNTTDLLDRREHIGFDFAVVEECGRFQECTEFADAYRGRAFDIEYGAKDFDRACRSWGRKLSVTLRDRDVSPAGEKAHVYRRCDAAG
ncbi:endo alpha-1,4 polygalactosaminidase [Streptomyces sp. NBC_01197]|uniref:endo alpha-1,4 polygalactosaminidase n=1 Tax=Streptomyces sp. NBC_01197 TaxID=2903768 RepID=UPI002E10CEE2|nr:endo alpha-1,4 polygalactosaminidase [Streptomyces sp. NBC_01197]